MAEDQIKEEVVVDVEMKRLEDLYNAMEKLVRMAEKLQSLKISIPNMDTREQVHQFARQEIKDRVPPADREAYRLIDQYHQNATDNFYRTAFPEVIKRRQDAERQRVRQEKLQEGDPIALEAFDLNYDAASKVEEVKRNRERDRQRNRVYRPYYRSQQEKSDQQFRHDEMNRHARETNSFDSSPEEQFMRQHEEAQEKVQQEKERKRNVAAGRKQSTLKKKILSRLRKGESPLDIFQDPLLHEEAQAIGDYTPGAVHLNDDAASFLQDAIASGEQISSDEEKKKILDKENREKARRTHRDAAFKAPLATAKRRNSLESSIRTVLGREEDPLQSDLLLESVRNEAKRQTGQDLTDDDARKQLEPIVDDVRTRMEATKQSKKSGQTDRSRLNALREEERIRGVVRSKIRKGVDPSQSEYLREYYRTQGVPETDLESKINDTADQVKQEMDQGGADPDLAKERLYNRLEGMTYGIIRQWGRGAVKKNKLLRREVERSIGSTDSKEVDDYIDQLTDTSMENMRTRPRSRTMLGLFGPGFSATQTYAFNQFASGFQSFASTAAGSAGSGQAFNPQEHMADILQMVGTMTALLPGFGLGGIALGIGGRALGGISDAYMEGRRRLEGAYQVGQVSTGFTPEDLQSTAQSIGSQWDPEVIHKGMSDWEKFTAAVGSLFGGSRIGQQAGLDVESSLDSLRAGGLSTADIKTLAQHLTALPGAGGEGLGAQAAAAAGQSMAPFFSDPLFSMRYLNNVSGNSKPLGQIQKDFAQPGAMVDSLISQGLPATLKVLEATNNQKLVPTAVNLFRTMTQMGATEQIQASTSGITQSSLQRLGATGQFIDTQAYKAAFESTIGSLSDQKKTIDDNINFLKQFGDNTANTAIKIAQLGEQSAALGAQIQVAKQSYALQVAQTQESRTEAGVTRAGIAAQRESFGLPAGKVAPSLATQYQQSEVERRQALANANNPLLPEVYRQQQRTLAEQLGLNQIQIARQAFTERFSAPAEQSRQGLGRQLAQQTQAQTFGYGEDALRKMTESTLQTTNRTIEREREELVQRQHSFDRGESTWQEVEEARNQLNQTQLQRNELLQQRALLPSQERLRYAGYQTSLVSGTAGFLEELRPGPAQQLTVARGLASAYREQAGGLEQQAKDLLANNPNETKAAEDLRNQAQMLQIQANSTELAGYQNYLPSAKQSLSLQQGSLGISLAEGDIATGGYVPTSMRRSQYTNLMKEVGNINDRIANTPDEWKDSVAASLEPQKAALLQQAQEQYQKIQFGDVGHVMNLLSGSTGFSTFSMPSIADFQRYNPNGTMVLGGTGKAVGMDPFSMMAYQPDLSGSSSGSTPTPFMPPPPEGGRTETDADVMGGMRPPASPVLAQAQQPGLGGGIDAQSIAAQLAQTNQLLQELIRIASRTGRGATDALPTSASASNPVANQAPRNGVFKNLGNLANGLPTNQ